MLIPHTLEVPVVIQQAIVDWCSDVPCEFLVDQDSDYDLVEVWFPSMSAKDAVWIDRHTPGKAERATWAAAVAESQRPYFRDKLPAMTNEERADMIRELTPIRLGVRVG